MSVPLHAERRAASLLAPLLVHARYATPALRAAEGELDYPALFARAAAHAQALRAAGVVDGDVVALPAQRSAEAVATILACIARGAAYLPLDLDFPATRITAMLEDARPRCFHGAADARVPAALARVPPPGDASAPPLRDDVAGELAYVLFTSGSTGRPKGVAMRSAAVAALIGWHCAHPRLGLPARTLQFAPLGFDVSFQEIFSTLASGGCLVLPTEAERRDPYALLALLERERVERLFLPYVGLQALAEAFAAGGSLPRALRDVVTAGEQLRITPAIRALFAALPGTVLHNHYGPTETHVVTAHELAGDPAAWPELPPIGAPLPHVRVRIVDAALAPLADGTEGELLLGGECLAAGYIHRAELTAERFVELDGERWYRTGDRARIDADGVLECFGRVDEQLKIDGFRVEPAEIETVLCRHPALAEAVVVAADTAGGRRLVAHVVARDARIDATALADELRAHCAASLADYLVPHAIVSHAVLPLTASGKIDRRALAAAPAGGALRWRDGAPLQNQLLDLWKQLLGVDDLDVEANLFDHGARSLLVVRALTELRRHGHVLSVAQAYEHPTVAAQARALTVAIAPVAAIAGERARGDAQRAAFARFGTRPGGAR
ncbi:MAG: non-ribosomal peptide synthetase [Dokdonella sp.]|uniref:non-ribosomal peptide synthetase n=1 Tax=Dokdonella sp. TaxID=2291710 RepID=UPI003F81C1DF